MSLFGTFNQVGAPAGMGGALGSMLPHLLGGVGGMMGGATSPAPYGYTGNPMGGPMTPIYRSPSGGFTTTAPQTAPPMPGGTGYAGAAPPMPQYQSSTGYAGGPIPGVTNQWGTPVPSTPPSTANPFPSGMMGFGGTAPGGSEQYAGGQVTSMTGAPQAGGGAPTNLLARFGSQPFQGLMSQFGPMGGMSPSLPGNVGAFMGGAGRWAPFGSMGAFG